MWNSLLFVLPLFFMGSSVDHKHEVDLKATTIAYNKKMEAKKQTECLASVVYHEARGESLKGQIAVARVVLNRKISKYYPNTICKVAFQKDQFTDLKKIKYDEKAWEVALKVQRGVYKINLLGATHYHADYVMPSWASWKRLNRVTKVGRHVFYRMV